jgi:uncharacterized protein (TIGR02271 family)
MASRTLSTVIAIFQTEAEARSAADDLRSNGFSSDDIFITSDTSRMDQQGMVDEGERHHHEGGIKGWFKSLFGQEDEEDRSYYENAVDRGNICLTVDVTDQNVDTAADILNRHSPIDIQREESGAGTAGATYAAGTSSAGYGSQAQTATSASSSAAAPASTDQGRAIPVVREELKVGKRAVLRGGVRVYSRLIEEPVEENVRLREENVRVERTPVNRDVGESDLRRGQEQVIEVKEYAEEPVVSKQARVVEEVRISKDASERTETVRDTVRHTEVNVENLSDAGTSAASASSSAAQSASGYARNAMSDTGAAAQQTYDEDFRTDYNQRYGSSGQPYDFYAPSYEYGYRMASDPRYKGRSFEDVESDLRQDYGMRYPTSTWERMKDAIRYGWDRVVHHSR